MDQLKNPEPLPSGWADAIMRGECDLAAGRIRIVDADALCREIEAEADNLASEMAVRPA